MHEHHHHPHDHEHEGSHLDDIELRVRALETLSPRRATSTRPRSTSSSRPTRRRSARATAQESWRKPGATRTSAAGSSPTPPPRSPRSASPGARASTWWRWRTRRRCTTWSCARSAPVYPWTVLGLPPVWYKSPPYRSRAVIDPRGVLAEFGVTLPETTKVRVWDSTAEIRYLVVPMRPPGTDGLSEAELADLVTRDSMIGTGLPRAPGAERG